MEIFYLIAKILIIVCSVLLGLVLLYLSIKAKSFFIALEELHGLVTKEIQARLLRSSALASSFISFIFDRVKNRASFGVLGFIIDTVKARFKS